MAPRAYNRALREAAAGMTRQRIVEAAAALHAERGASDTSHAQIARRAGVSVPTVYKHFPTPNDVVPACTGLVLGRAPVALDAELFHGRAGVPARLRALVEAVFRLHEYLAPWLRWPADLRTYPALGPVLAGARESRRAMVREALRPRFRSRPPAELVDLMDVLLDFPSWQALASGGRSTEKAAALAADALVLLFRGG